VFRFIIEYSSLGEFGPQVIGLFSGGRPEGSKRNLKFQSATWSQAPFTKT
jgi:hypothetical protein